MGLKQSIVVVNEYTIKTESGGTRGGSPGDYVLRYMAREDAIEYDVPSLGATDDYIRRYMARQEAAERASDYEPKRRAVGHRGGVAFSGSSSSLTYSELVEASNAIQQAFDDGKTVLKTVISFDEKYLRENGIIPENFVFEKAGDYRGNIDQMKLRHAVMNGISHMSQDYDDLQFVGVIQVDTEHVHCHLAMVDMGVGNLAPDGKQRGKISSKSAAKLRRGIDSYMDETKEVQFMASNVGLDRRNMQTAMKKYTYEQVLLYGAPQRIMTALPDDSRLWRAGSNRKEMRQANKICRDYVERIFAKPDSGIGGAMQSIRNYADARQRREGLTEDERLNLVRRGREKLVENCMNSVYATLRQAPDSMKSTTTPFLDAVAQQAPVPSYQGDVQDFVYRAGAYQSRLAKHRTEAKRYDSFARDYERAQAAGTTDPAADALYQFFIIERQYQSMLASKYSQMVFEYEPEDDTAEEYLKLVDEARRLNGMREFAADPSVKNMKPDTAEDYGKERYGIYGGRYFVVDRPYFQQRVDIYARKYEQDAQVLNQRLAVSGKALEDGEKGPVIVKKPAFDFEDVKGLDLHDLRGDFSGGLSFSGDVRLSYMNMARRRLAAYDAACSYLDDSGQGELKAVFDTRDMENMRDVLYSLESNEPLKIVEQPVVALTQKKTAKLDKSMHQYISRIIKADVSALERAESFNLREAIESSVGDDELD